MKKLNGSRYYDLLLDCKRDGDQQDFRWLNMAVMGDESRPFLRGIRIEEDRAMSADGFRAHVVYKSMWGKGGFKIPEWEPPNTYMNRRGRISYYAASAGWWAKDLFEIRKQEPPKTMIINNGGRLRKTAGKQYPIKCFVEAVFPNIDRIMPPQGKQVRIARVYIDSTWLQWACDMPDLMRIHFGFSRIDGDVVLNVALEDDKGDKTHVAIPRNIESEVFEDIATKMDFAFNPQYISDAAEMPINNGDIELHFYAPRYENDKWGNGSPLVIEGYGGEHRAIIMPINTG